VLPLAENELYDDVERVVDLTGAAIKIARSIGAKTISLTGLLPSATRYGESFARLDGCAVTTGHATTAACIVVNLAGLLRAAGRDLEDESVAVLGLGSIGRASLRAALSVLPHPRRLVLCEVPSRIEETRTFAAGLAAAAIATTSRSWRVRGIFRPRSTIARSSSGQRTSRPCWTSTGCGRER
jgi:predicted amino acid dehydrogenase